MKRVWVIHESLWSLQGKIYAQQLLRRKAEAGDGSLSASDAKRQRTTKSPNRGRDPRSTGWKHEYTEKKHALPSYMSSFGMSMTDHWNLGIEHQFPSTMTKEVKRKPIHMYDELQRSIGTKLDEEWKYKVS